MIPLVAFLVLGGFLLGWHARDRVDSGPDWDHTAARRLARRFWKRRRHIAAHSGGGRR